MRKPPTISILIFILSTCLFMPATFGDSNYDFRKTRWGASREEVKTSDSFLIARETNNSIIYTGKVANMKTLIVYFFADGSLFVRDMLLKKTMTITIITLLIMRKSKIY